MTFKFSFVSFCLFTLCFITSFQSFIIAQNVEKKKKCNAQNLKSQIYETFASLILILCLKKIEFKFEMK